MRTIMVGINIVTIAAGLGAAVVAFSGVGQRQDLQSPEWKDEIAKGYLPYRQLTVEDFPIDDRIVSPYKMHAEGFIHYTFRTSSMSSGGSATAQVTSFTIRSGFDRNKSWRRSTVSPDANLLAHEQGHLDISESDAARFMKVKLPTGIGVDAGAATDQVRAKLKESYMQLQTESQAEQDKYDLETRHGADRERQATWTDLLHERLKALKILK